MDKENVVYILHEILFIYKKKEILSFAAAWKNLEIRLNEARHRRNNIM
jgi:hypothetical protein